MLPSKLVREGEAMKIRTASEIAQYFIVSSQRKNKPISNLKLQKLLYYAQAWHLVLQDSPLFSDNIEAWVHGPVVRQVFRAYRSFGWRPLEIDCKSTVDFDNQTMQHLNEVAAVYGKFDGIELERMTHSEAPWRDARGSLAPDEPSNRVITHEAMKQFYSARLNG
jgi:uncharacterized phage-associated protein